MNEIFESSKVELLMHVAGVEKLHKESFSDLKEGATGEEMLDFADIIADLQDVDYMLEYCVGTVATRYTR